MRTRPAVTVGVTALGLLLGGSMSVFAQFTSDEPRESEAWAQEHLRASVFTPTPVLDFPFSGEGVTTWRPASNSGSHEVRATARYYRDRAGRVRVEQTLVGQTRGASPQSVTSLPMSTGRGAICWTLLHERPPARRGPRGL